MTLAPPPRPAPPPTPPAVTPAARRPVVTLISARFPPRLDGIGDYTARLATELTQHADARVLTGGADPPDAPPRVSVATVFDPVRRRSVLGWADHLAADPPDAVVLQFNQFSFGRWGLNPWVPAALGRIRRRCPHTRIAVMYHERYVPATTARFRVMRRWQIPQFRAVGQRADHLFFSIENWAQRYADWFRDRPVTHLPVGSNIPHLGLDPADARRRLNINPDELVVGLFGHAHGTRGLQALDSVLRRAGQATGRPTRLLYIGPDHAAVRASLPGHVLTADGTATADEVSRRLSAIDLYLSDHTDGVSTRRGSMMAALQHGLCVLGTTGESTGDHLQAQHGSALHLVPAGNPDALARAAATLAADPGARAHLARGGQVLYENTYDWPVIARRLIAELLP